MCLNKTVFNEREADFLNFKEYKEGRKKQKWDLFL